MLQNAMARRRRGEAGFTLVELLVVIVILAILAAVVVFAVGGINDKGKTSACDADESSLATAEEAYFAQHDAYAWAASKYRDAKHGLRRGERLEDHLGHLDVLTRSPR